jgi:hypothetical protein
VHVKSENILQSPAISGRVLVAGCGLVITGAAWSLFGYAQHLQAEAAMAVVFFILSGIHALTGAGTLFRQRYAWVIALLIGTIGLVLALSVSQFVLVATNLVTLLLLILARDDVTGKLNGADRGATPAEHSG